MANTKAKHEFKCKNYLNYKCNLNMFCCCHILLMIKTVVIYKWILFSQHLLNPFSSSPSVRFLYDVVSLCEREAVMLLTVINSCIFSLNSTDCQSEVSLLCFCSKTFWNPRLTCCGIINQKFRSFSRFLKIPVNVITYKCAGFTSDRDSLSWSRRLRSRSLSQDDFC